MMDLNHPKIWSNLGEALSKKKHLQYLDLSWTNLGPEALKNVSALILECTHTLRDLNLSYNQANSDISKEADSPFAIEFVENIG